MFKQHPRGLRVLFFTEMWERFSYYGMRGILLLFMVNAVETGGFGMDAATAAAIYGLYTAMVYLLALPGGWIADKILGQKKAVFIGGIFIALGHFSMAVPFIATFYGGLVLIVIGTGLLKPNVSAIVGDLYPEGGAKRDAGFSIFYMGINVGAFAGPLICGFLGESINWHLGFSAAGIGMVAGLIQYKMGEKHLGEAGKYKHHSKEYKTSANRQLMAGFGAIFLIAIVLALLHTSQIINITLLGVASVTGIVIVALAILYFSYILIFGGLDSLQKKRVVVIFFLFIGAAIFWAGFEQAGSSMNLFAERLTDRVVLGFEAPASWLQSVNPIFIISLAPVFGWLWIRLGDKEPSIPVKFAYGLILLGAGFAVMAWASTFTLDGGKVTPMWLILTYLLHTCGELCLSPVGLSSVTKLSPKHLVGQMMGTWFMGSALGNLIAGLVAGQFETLPLPELFGIVCMISAGSGFLFLIFSRPIKKLIGSKL